MKKRFFCIVIFLLVFHKIFSQTNFMEEGSKRWLDKAYEKRREISALSYLLTEPIIWQYQSSKDREKQFDKILESEDANPFVKSYVSGLKRLIMFNKRQFDKARFFFNLDSYLKDFILLGPFPNENKEGLNTAFQFEEEFDVSKVYKGINDREIKAIKISKDEYFPAIPLNEIVFPNKKATAYLVFYLYVDTPQNVVFRVSASGAFKLFLNGEEIYRNENYNVITFDQYSASGKLSSGFNLLVVKTCNDNLNWYLKIRITDGIGNPLKNIKVENDISKVKESLSSILKKNGKASNFRFVDFEEELKKRALNGGFEEKFEYALCLMGKKSFDISAHKDLLYFKELLEEYKDKKFLNFFIALCEDDENRKRDFLLEAIKSEEFKVEALFELFNHYFYSRRMTFKALEFINQALEIRKDDPLLLVQKFLVFSMNDILKKEIKRDFEEILKKESDNPRFYQLFYNLFSTDMTKEEKEKFISYIFNNYYYYDSVKMAFDFYSQLGKKNEAIKVLKEFLSLSNLLDSDLVLTLSNYLKNQGEYSEAAYYLKSFLSYAPFFSEGRELLGDIYILMNEREKALNEFKETIFINPQNDSLKRKIAYLQPEEEVFYKNYKIEMSEIPKPDEKYKDLPSQILLQNTYVEVQKTGLSTRYEQFVVKIQSNFGGEYYSSFPIVYDPDYQQVRIIEAYLEKPDGKRIQADFYTTPYLQEPQYQLYYRLKQFVITFQGLKKNDTIYIEYVITDNSEINSYGNYFGDLVLFQLYEPIMKKIYTLKIPEDMKIYYKMEREEINPIILKVQNHRIFQWKRENIEHIKKEPFSPGITEIAPYLHISTFENMEDLGKWYASFIKDQWELSAEAKKYLSALIEGKESIEEKVKAIHNFVASQTHYVGLEFGVHGYKPYKAKQVFERRFGDCKDKALLLCSLLREAGIEASMVLVRTKNLGEISKSPASLNSFNHAIAYVPAIDKFLDGTAEFSGIDELPYFDEGVEVLIVSYDGNVFTKRTKESSAEDNVFNAKYVFKVRKNEPTVKTKGFYEVSGQEASLIRNSLQNDEKRKELLEKKISKVFPSTKINEATFSNLNDLNSEVEISFEGEFNGVIKPISSNMITIPTWLGDTSISPSFAPTNERKYDLVVSYPFIERYEVTYIFENGLRYNIPSEKLVQSEFGKFSRRVEKDENSLKIVSEFVLTTRRVPKEKYREFKDFLNTIDKILSERIEVKW